MHIVRERQIFVTSFPQGFLPDGRFSDRDYGFTVVHHKIQCPNKAGKFMPQLHRPMREKCCNASPRCCWSEQILILNLLSICQRSSCSTARTGRGEDPASSSQSTRITTVTFST